MTDKKAQKKGTNQKHHCADNCIRHGDCECGKCTENCNDKKVNPGYHKGGILPISRRILEHIMTGDRDHLRDVLSIMDNTSMELHMGYKYLEILSQELTPFLEEDTKLIQILKQMDNDIKKGMNLCRDVISEYTFILEDIEDMKTNGEISKEIAERYLDVCECPEKDDEDPEDEEE